MGLKVIWSTYSEERLFSIYKYYRKKVSKTVATNLLNGIVKAGNELNTKPLIGQIEPMLISRNETFRYTLYKSYKIIYVVYQNEGYIKIANVFDCRRNPDKIKLTK